MGFEVGSSMEWDPPFDWRRAKKAARPVLNEDDEQITAGSNSSQTHPACSRCVV